MVTHSRYTQLVQWLHTHFPQGNGQIQPLAGDASFRKYYRFIVDEQRFVVMDAPPHTEKNHAFQAIAEMLIQQGIQAPKIYAQEREQGFMLLTDFGDDLYLNILNEHNSDQYYKQAIKTLLAMQTCTKPDGYSLPCFDEAYIHQQFALYHDWFLTKALHLSISSEENQQLQGFYHYLTDMIKQQPQVFVHFDYHSRNILLLDDQELGVIDFQDAVLGPITYDLVSLCKDCYLHWPREQVLRWVHYYYQLATASGLLEAVTLPQFIQWFDLTGMQRHIKILGVFSRLHRRDQKSQYLQHIPLILDYLLAVEDYHPTVRQFKHFIRQRVLPS